MPELASACCPSVTTRSDVLLSDLGARDESAQSGVEDLKRGPELVDLCAQVQDLVLRRDRNDLEGRVGTPRHEAVFHLRIYTCVFACVRACVRAWVRACVRACGTERPFTSWYT